MNRRRAPKSKPIIAVVKGQEEFNKWPLIHTLSWEKWDSNLRDILKKKAIANSRTPSSTSSLRP